MTSSRTTDVPSAHTDGPGVRYRLRTVHLVLGASLLMIAAQLWLRGDVLRHGYFILDDYVYVSRAVEEGLSPRYLFQNYSGQFMPFGFAVTWLLARFAPYDWGAALAVALTLQGCASLAVLRALRVLFGARWLILLPFALYASTPITLPATGWYAAAINGLPLQIGLAMAFAALVRYLRRKRTTYLAQTVGWTAFAMTAYVKAGAIPLVLFAFTSAYFFTGSWRDGVLAAWNRYRRLWYWLARLLAVHICAYALSWGDSAMGARNPGANTSVDFVTRLVVRTFTMYFVGGPWEWADGGMNYASPDPPEVQIALAVGVAVAVIALSVRFRRVAERAWAILFGYVLVADCVPVLVGRVPLAGAWLASDSHYVADAAALLTICLGLAFLPLVGEKEPYVRPVPAGAAMPAVAGVAAGAVVAASYVCVRDYARVLGHGEGRAWVTAAAATLRRGPDLTAVFPSAVPSRILPSTYEQRAWSTHVLAPLATARQRKALGHPRPTQEPFVFGADGRLHPAGVYGVTTYPPPRHGTCWYIGKKPVDIPLTGKVGEGDYAMSLGFLASKPTGVRIAFDGRQTVTIQARPKTGRYVFMIHGQGDTVRVTKTVPDAPLCVTDVAAGYAVPTDRE